MGLSEFISKNNNERPDPTEWEKGKKLMGVLVASGAVQLLEQLKRSILANPVLRQGSEGVIRLDKTLIVSNPAAVRVLAEVDRNPIKGIIIGEIEKNHYIRTDMVLPTAFLIFRYNFRTVGHKGTPFQEGSYDYYGQSDAIVLGCSDPEEIFGISHSMFSYDKNPNVNSSYAAKLKIQELKIPGRMDDFLGKIYSKAPARSTEGEIKWY